MQLTLRTIGFVGSLLLTLAAYFLILNPAFFNVASQTATLIILGLALVQSIVQLICFINLWREKGPLWNLAVFFSTAVIIFIIIFFSIWIMNHLNDNMMP